MGPKYRTLILFIDSLCVAWNKAVRRVWRLPTRCHTRLLPQLNIKDQFIFQFSKLYHAMLNNGNELTSYFARRGGYYVKSVIGKNIVYVYDKFQLWLQNNDSRSVYVRLQNKKTFSCEQDNHKGQLIHEFCNSRDGLNVGINFTRNELDELIELLTTE